MALPLLVFFLASPSHGFYLAGSTVRTDTSLAELLFSLLQPGARAQKRRKKQVGVKILVQTETPQKLELPSRSIKADRVVGQDYMLDLVIAFSSSIWLLPTDQKTLVIR